MGGDALLMLVDAIFFVLGFVAVVSFGFANLWQRPLAGFTFSLPLMLDLKQRLLSVLSFFLPPCSHLFFFFSALPAAFVFPL